MGVSVTFDFATWQELFPQFSDLTQTQVVNFALPLAQQYCRNDGGGPVNDAVSQASLLNLMVAHVCQLLFGANGQPPSQLVGRISGASEGSVSVSTADFPSSPSSAWYNMTSFGAMFWAATAPYRTATYYAPARRRLLGRLY